MEIRPLAPSDLAAVLDLNNRNVPAVNGLDAPEVARLATLSSVALVAEVDGVFAGFCMVMPPGVDYASLNYAWFGAHAGELGYGSWAYLDRIAVVADARRHGVGRALYAAVLEQLRGVSPVLFCEVNVRPRNDQSLAFHASLGFREVGQQDTDGGGKTVSLLALDLG
jgi:predicted GNAT superfamily acetyltransferase